MFSQARTPAQAYRQLGVETALSDASPHRLIEMLYEGLDRHLAQALAAIERGDIALKGESIGRALRIVDEGLKAALDDRGGDLTERLRGLYQYSSVRLLEANLRSDSDAIREVRGLFAQLHDAWREIAGQTRGLETT